MPYPVLGALAPGDACSGSPSRLPSHRSPHRSCSSPAATAGQAADLGIARGGQGRSADRRVRAARTFTGRRPAERGAQRAGREDRVLRAIARQLPIFPVVETRPWRPWAPGWRRQREPGHHYQAVTEHAAAVVTDSIPYGFAQQGFAAWPPITSVGDEPRPGPGGTPVGSNQLAFLETQVSACPRTGSSDSGGHADVLVIEITDSPLTVQAITAGALAQFRTLCPGCTVHLVRESTAKKRLSDLPSNMSSALLKDPEDRLPVR